MDFLVMGAAYAALAISAFIAVRLLRMSRRTGNAPETAMGFYEAFIVLAVAVYTAARFVGDGAPAMLFRFAVVGNFLITCGVIALALGTWRIYRAGESWPRLVCALLAVWVLAGWLWTSSGDALPMTAAATTANLFFVAGRTSVYAWGAFEAFSFYRLLRRRLALGLIEPLVVHQVLLWGLFCVCMGMTAVISLATGFALGDAVRQWKPATVINAALSFSASYCLWFAFFPPRFYRSLFAARVAPAVS